MNLLVIHLAALVSANVRPNYEKQVGGAQKMLSDVYGDARVHKAMKSYSSRKRRGRAGMSNTLAGRTGENCTFPIELVLVQDLTASFEGNLENMVNVEIRKMYESMTVDHPGSTYGSVSFRDIPIWTLGSPQTDYCYKEANSLDGSFEAISNAYNTFESHGGGDEPEAQFLATISAVNSQSLGWGRTPGAAKLAVVVTDSTPHFDDDGLNKYGMAPYSSQNIQEACSEQYYPGPEIVKEALVSSHTYFGALVYDRAGTNGSHVIDSWKWFNNYIEQATGFVHNMETDSGNFWEQFSKIITTLESIECSAVTTTSPAPTTEVIAPGEGGVITSTDLPTTLTTIATTTNQRILSTPLLCQKANFTTCSEGEKDCNSFAPEVLIKIANRPKHMRLKVDYGIVM